MNDLVRSINEVTGGKATPIDELAMLLKGLRQYRKTPTDVLRRKLIEIEEKKQAIVRSEKGEEKTGFSRELLSQDYSVDFEDIGGYEEI